MFTGAPVPHSFYYEEEEEQKDSGYKGTCIDVDGNKYSCMIMGSSKEKIESPENLGGVFLMLFILVTCYWIYKIKRRWN